MKFLTLKKNEERRLRRGHLWIFSNEVQNLQDGFEPGEVVGVQTSSRGFLGVAYVNPHSLICARLLARRRRPIDRAFVADRLTAARRWRDRFIGGEHYRLFYSEADGFPGLVVDRYGEHLVVQAHTQGAYRYLDTVVDVLRELCMPATITLRNDAPGVGLEGLEPERRMLLGDPPTQVEFTLDGVQYRADLWQGQKTGFYLDQRENRLALAPYVDGADVLDVFCYSGAWSLTAARCGAATVTGIDSSGHAVELARANAAANAFGTRCTFEQQDAFDAMRACAEAGRRFDVICLDPPPYARSKSHIRQALEKYQRVNTLALTLLRSPGILVTCSCSAHVRRQDFTQRLAQAAHKAQRRTQLLEWRGQARDHPVLPAMRETAYLKCAILHTEA